MVGGDLVVVTYANSLQDLLTNNQGYDGFIETPMIAEEIVEMSLEFGFYEALKSYVAFPRA